MGTTSLRSHFPGRSSLHADELPLQLAELRAIVTAAPHTVSPSPAQPAPLCARTFLSPLRGL